MGGMGGDPETTRLAVYGAYGRKLASCVLAGTLVISVAIGWLVTPCLRTPRLHQTQDPIDPRLRPC